MKIYLALNCFILLTAPIIAAPIQNPLTRTVFSSTGQFLVQGPPPQSGRPRYADPSINLLIRVNTDQLALTCERVKTALLRELNVVDIPWLSRIHVNILPYAQAMQPVNIGAFRLSDGWRYQVDVPEQVAPDKLVRGLVQVLLLELANRQSVSHSAEIPLFLVEGFTRQLLLGSRLEIILPHQSTTVASGVRTDPVNAARELLRGAKALTFAELGSPTGEMLSPPKLELFQACSQLLAVELGRLPGGHDCMVQFLHFLSKNLNWQVAFLRGFRSQFGTLLQIEKWWALRVASFTGRNPALMWAEDQAPNKLQELLMVSVRRAATTNSVPKQVQLSLQEAIRTIEFSRQRGLIRQKIGQLVAARVNVVGNLYLLAAAYQKALEDYLYRRERVGYAPVRRGEPPLTAKLVIDESVKRLDALDVQFATLKGAGAAGTNAAPR